MESWLRVFRVARTRDAEGLLSSELVRSLIRAPEFGCRGC